jgi:hypothetical protein
MPGWLRQWLSMPLLALAIEAQKAPDSPPAGYGQEQIRRLPHGFAFWDLLESVEPAGVSDSASFGGLSAARLPLYAAGAASWTETRYRLNHADAGEVYIPGRPLFLPDVEALENFRAGDSVSAVTRTGEADWHGRVSSAFTGSALASENLTSRALRAGLLRSESFRWYTRDRIELTGRLGPRAGFFVSGAGQWASQTVPRDRTGGALNTRLLVGTAGALVRLSPRDRLRAAFTGSRVDLSGFGMPAGLEALAARRMAPPLEPHPDQREEDHLDSVQAAWAREQRPGRVWEVRYGYVLGHLDTALPPRQAAILPHLDLADGPLAGPPPLANLGVRARHQLEALWRRQAGTGFLLAGVNWQRAHFRNRFTAPCDAHTVFAGGASAHTVHLNTPLDSRGRPAEITVSVAGTGPLGHWLSLSGGADFVFARGTLPPQSSPPGSFASAREFPRGQTVISWRDAVPWTAIRLAPPFARRLSLTGHYRRTLKPLAGRYLDYANPNSLSGEEYSPEGFLLRRFGGAYSAIDPALARPYSDEFSASLDAELPRALAGRLRLFRRDDRRRLAAVNRGVPSASYRSRSYLDPGGDFVPGSFDDQILEIWEQDPRTFGQDRFLLTNTRLGSFSSGLVAELEQRGQRHWWRLSFAAEKGYATTNPGNAPWENDAGVVGALLADPNTLVNATGRVYFDRAYLARFWAAARLPRRLGALDLGVIVSYWDGLPFGRRLLVQELAQGPLVVMATPRGSPEGGHRTEYLLDADIRLSRRISLPRGALRLTVDVFNLPNLSHNTRERDWSGPEFNQRLPLAIQPPRFVRTGLEWEF